jgi:hypothetical protein
MTTNDGLEKLRGWFTGRLPDSWFDGALQVVLDREEVSVIGPLAEPGVAEDASAAERGVSSVVARRRCSPSCRSP